MPHSVNSDDPRLENTWKKLPLDQIEHLHQEGAVVIVGYADDEGIRLSHGRAGAKDGPARILFYLGRMIAQPGKTPPVFILEKFPAAQPPSLAERHESAERVVKNFLKEGFRVITIGGGHDYGYSDAAAYFEVHQGTILNLDAHLDLRPVQNNVLNSGTPFYRFVQRFGGEKLIEWGIQPQCNAAAHLQYAADKKVRMFTWEDPQPQIAGPVGLSIDLDAFAGIRGVSAPAMVGLSTAQGVKCVQTFAAQSQWIGLYESAPSLDPGTEDSARYGARLAYEFIHGV